MRPQQPKRPPIEAPALPLDMPASPTCVDRNWRWVRRKGGMTTPYLGQQAQLLRTIAKHWVKAAAEDVAALTRFSSGLSTRQQRGMTEKNRALLRQFNEPANVRAILLLPERVFRELDKAKVIARDEALRAMLAFAVHLLAVTLLRVNNLAGLDLAHHFVVHGSGRQRTVHIVIPAQETKTSMHFERELPEASARLLDRYVTKYRPLLCPGDNPWLFPNDVGGRRCTVSFSQAISRFIRHDTGLKMHAHLFRHLGVKLHQSAHPDDMETPRRLLGHSSMAMLRKAYAEMQGDAAHKRYDQTLGRLLAASQVGTQAKARPQASRRPCPD